MALVIYGIPTCGSCKKAQKWLKERTIDYRFINLKDEQPATPKITGWAQSFGVAAMKNTSGQSYRALGDKRKTMSDQDWLVAFADDAMLLKRPIIMRDERAVLVGFKASEEELERLLVE